MLEKVQRLLFGLTTAQRVAGKNLLMRKTTDDRSQFASNQSKGGFLLIL